MIVDGYDLTQNDVCRECKYLDPIVANDPFVSDYQKNITCRNYNRCVRVAEMLDKQRAKE